MRSARPCFIPPIIAAIIAGLPALSAAVSPSVTGGAPSIKIVTIGAGYASVTLTGTGLNLVQSVSVINAGGRVQRGFQIRINPRGRTDSRLNLGALAGPLATVGSYDLRLNYERPPPRKMTQTTKQTPLTMRVHERFGRIQVQMMTPTVTIQPNPSDARRLTITTVTVNQLPGNTVVSIKRDAQPGDGGRYCQFNPWVYARQIVACDSPNAGRRVASRGTSASPGPGRLLPAAFNYDFKREANACYERVAENYTSQWLTPNRLEIHMPSGVYESPTENWWHSPGSSCLMVFSVRTKDSAGNEYYTRTPNTFLRFKPE